MSHSYRQLITKNVTLKGAFTLFISLFLAYLLSACSRPFETQEAKKYQYKNPTSGDRVSLRTSITNDDSNLEEIAEKALLPQIINPEAQVLLKDKKASVRFTRLMNGEKTNFELAGTLDEHNTGTLLEVNPINGKAQFKALIGCNESIEGANDCPDLYIDIYYVVNGKLKKTQLITDSRLDQNQTLKPLKLKKGSPKKLNPTTNTHSQSGYINNVVTKPKEDEMVVINPQSPDDYKDIIPAVPELKNEEEFNANLISQEDIINDDVSGSIEGEFVTPVPDKEFFDDLNVENDEITKLEQKKSLLTTSQSGFPFNFATGGIAKNYPNRGYIVGEQKPLEKSNPGLTRISIDQLAYGSGLLQDFLKEAAKRFNEARPECGNLHVKNISRHGGKKLPGQLSHQNGLDADITYIPYQKFTSVLDSKGRMRSDFNYKCNYDYLKYLSSHTLPSKKRAVSAIFVNAKVKNSLCWWAKSQKLNSEEDKGLFDTLYTWSGHHDHFHIRMRCAPTYKGCYTEELRDKVRCSL